MKSFAVKGKEYVFRERVEIGQLLKAELLRKRIDTKTIQSTNPVNEWWQWRKLNKLWMQLCDIIFTNADNSMNLRVLTPGEATAIPENFFAFMEENQKKSSASSEPSASSPADEAR